LDCQVSLSLNALTSPNGHAFLAVVMHYILNDWKLGMLFLLSHKLKLTLAILTEELLIDFAEIQGEHSGENMAQTV
jgi:hypothetical protein